MLLDGLYGLTGFVFGILCRSQQRLLAAGHEQQQALPRPIEGRNKFGAVLDGKPARRPGADINQASALLEAGLGRAGRVFNRGK